MNDNLNNINNNGANQDNDTIKAADTDTATDYISVIKKLKSETVPIEDYQKLRKENQNLIDSLANGSISVETEKPKALDVAELRKKLFEPDLTNLEYCQTAVDLRNALLENGEPDPFLPIGRNIAPEENSKKDAENVADVLEQCIEYAAGDSDIFTDALQRRMVDLPRPRRKN